MPGVDRQDCVQFRIEAGQVLVEQIGHRDGFYDGD
jgi:hypothetical protein